MKLRYVTKYIENVVRRRIESVESGVVPEFRTSLYLWGGPGTGKTSACNAVASSMSYEAGGSLRTGIPMLSLALATMDSVEQRGFPEKQKFWLSRSDSGWSRGVVDGAIEVDSYERMTWVANEYFPDARLDPYGILLLDDMASAPMSVQNGAYELLQFGRCGSAVLPPGWTVIAASNRHGDGAGVNKVSTALGNRCQHIEVDIDFDAWMHWAKRRGINPKIISFLRFRPDLLYDFAPDKLFKEHAVAGTKKSYVDRTFPSLRSWESMHEVMLDWPDYEDAEGVFSELATGTIGNAAAREFCAHVRLKDIPERADIIKDPDGVKIPLTADKQIRGDVAYTLVGLLTRSPKMSEIPAILRFGDRLARNGNAEFQSVLIMDLLSSPLSDKIQALPALKEWNDKWIHMMNGIRV